jgi:hypothetical protein
MIFIYVLKLENNKYYIGKSTNPKSRIHKHFSNNGSVWTKIHKPIKVIEIISNCDIYDEDKITLKYMDKYGIKNVRGGYFCQPSLTSIQLHFLIQLLRSINDKCLCCGSNDHFVNQCKGIKQKQNHNINNLDELDELDKLDKLNKLDKLDKLDKLTNNNYLISSLIYLFNIIEEFINPNYEAK